MKIQDNIRAFMLLAGQATPGKPTIPNAPTRILRAKLILEEAMEQCNALGIELSVVGSKMNLRDEQIEYIPCIEPNLIEIADGACDQLYVTVGTAIACGINLEKPFEIVHRSNMDKFGEGSYKREDGKQMKPPGWKPPTEALELEIDNQSNRS